MFKALGKVLLILLVVLINLIIFFGVVPTMISQADTILNILGGILLVSVACLDWIIIGMAIRKVFKKG